jgi:hypothetical protein
VQLAELAAGAEGKGEMKGKMKSVALVSCVSQKLDKAAPAAELYTSDWFRKAVAWIKAATFDQWYILSAKHGLVAPDQRIRPYDETLARMKKDDRRKWAKRVTSQVVETVGIHPPAAITILAGDKYREFLVPELRSWDYRIELPLKGMGIGEQKRWLAEHTVTPPRMRRPERQPNPFESIRWDDPSSAGARMRNAIEEYGTIWFHGASLHSLEHVERLLYEAIMREKGAEHTLYQKIAEYEKQQAKGSLVQEAIKCGKATCWCYNAPEGEGHGPYWYVYWSEGGKTRKKYIGKNKANAPAILKGLNIRLDDEELEDIT